MRDSGPCRSAGLKWAGGDMQEFKSPRPHRIPLVGTTMIVGGWELF